MKNDDLAWLSSRLHDSFQDEKDGFVERVAILLERFTSPSDKQIFDARNDALRMLRANRWAIGKQA